jgi:transposase InsO family protein
MNSHSRARSTPLSRAELVRRVKEGSPIRVVAPKYSLSVRTAYKWVARFRSEGAVGLVDRLSVPGRMPRRTPSDREAVIVLLRHCRMSGPAIARQLGMPRSTVARVLSREGLGRPRRFPPSAVCRYERKHPGDLVHLDTKKLGRIVRPGHRINGDRRTRVQGAGWDYVHIAIDDASRLVYLEVLDDELGVTCAAFLRRAVAHFRRFGIAVRQLLTDNGSGYLSGAFRLVCARERLQHLRTRPYRPCTNGKAERFIQTLLRECAYARPFRHSTERKRVLRQWLVYYNRWRPHGGLAGKPPLSRLDTPVNNVSGNYT